MTVKAIYEGDFGRMEVAIAKFETTEVGGTRMKMTEPATAPPQYTLNGNQITEDEGLAINWRRYPGMVMHLESEHVDGRTIYHDHNRESTVVRDDLCQCRSRTDAQLCECDRWRNGIEVCPVHNISKPPPPPVTVYAVVYEHGGPPGLWFDLDRARKRAKATNSVIVALPVPVLEDYRETTP